MNTLTVELPADRDLGPIPIPDLLSSMSRHDAMSGAGAICRDIG